PVADRYDRRKVLIIVSILQAIAATSFLLIGDSKIWIAFVAQGFIAGLAAFVRPALEAAIPNLAKNPDELRQANAIFGSSWGVMLAAGAGIGGIFSQAFGRNAAFIADVVTFIIAALLIAAVTRPMQEARTKTQTRRIHPIRDMGEALHLAKSDPAIMSLLMSKSRRYSLVWPTLAAALNGRSQLMDYRCVAPTKCADVFWRETSR
ncbi:MAG: MFS transporter, partial [Acidimicrobiia bacterium]|nr:MFS transporter [Acidimicrobiia bacterium]